MKRQSFTLIEVLICLTLFTILLGSLFTWYRHLSVDRARISQSQAYYAEEHLAQEYLHEVFSHIQAPVTSVGDNGIAFIFDRGLYDKPQLAGEVLGHLHLDKKTGHLSLGTWPHPKEGATPHETQLLLTHVTEIAFRFFFPPDPKALEVEPNEIGKPRPTLGWQKRWDAAYPTLPAFIELRLMRPKEREVIYCFELPVPLIYKKEVTS